MFNKATNTCMYIMTKRNGKLYCQEKCVGEFCWKHNLRLRKGFTLATLCSKCHKNGTRSITNLCLECGGQQELARILTLRNYYRKKVQNKEQNVAFTHSSVECQ